MKSDTYNVGGVELPRPFKMRRLGHWGTFQPDLAAARAFYVDQLGFRLTDELVFEPGDPPLGFFTTHCTDHHSMVCVDAVVVKGRDPLYEAGVTINQLSFQVGSLEEVVRGHAYFEELGLQLWRVGRDSPGSNWAVYVQDPDGHNVELYYGMEQIGWDRRSKPLPARLATHEAPQLPQPSERQELEACEAAGGSLLDGFRPDEPLPYPFDVGGVTLQRPFRINAVGPVYLFVKDVARSQAFYENVMGLQFSEEVRWGEHRAVFLRCGTDHHVLALFPEAARASLGWPAATTTMCLGVQVCSYEQLREARIHLLDQGLQSGQALPPELHPGIDHAAFFIDPAGQTVMLYFSMEQIGWDGRTRAPAERRRITEEWPETISAASDTYADQLLQGPLA
jgi:catechol 2,3-dioxygenase-like lactoylglutathione lyase family enzyme